MKSIILLIAIFATLFTFAYGHLGGCIKTQSCETSEVAAQFEITDSVPTSGFVANPNSNSCVFNCEWFVRTARRDNPAKPCTLQRGRNGRFTSSCVQEQICTGCRHFLMLPRQPFYLSSSDTVPRCPKFPEDLDAFTDDQLTTARDICRQVAKCNCVSGPIFPQVLSVRE